MKSKIIIGSDHAGFKLKTRLIKYLEKHDFNVEDKGIYEMKRSDYPDIASIVAKEVQNTDFVGILICGTGIGMSVTANKYSGIRAALIYNKKTAKLAAQHNNANIITLGGRQINYNKAKHMVNLYLNTKFEKGRHLKRTKKIKEIENE
ncbi:MAG: ribose 5-phosphate isomerase B [Halanaerobiales bacterium]